MKIGQRIFCKEYENFCYIEKIEDGKCVLLLHTTGAGRHNLFRTVDEVNGDDFILKPLHTRDEPGKCGHGNIYEYGDPETQYMAPYDLFDETGHFVAELRHNRKKPFWWQQYCDKHGIKCQGWW